MPTHSYDNEASSSQYLSISDASQTGLETPTTALTLQAWVKVESTGAGRPVITKNYTSGSWASPYVSYMLRVNSTGVIEFGTSNGTTYDGLLTTMVLSTGIFYHIAAVYNGSTKKIYINGFEAASVAYSATIGYNTGNFEIGNNNGAEFFDGLVKDVRVFSDARTQAEIVADAHTENITDANLQGEWNLNNAYTDSSGNGNTLTASGSPVFSTDIPWEEPTDIGSSTTLDTSLVSDFEMDGDATDATATANDLTANNSPTYTTGLVSQQAASLNGSTQYFSIADASQTGLDLGTDFTLNTWAKITNITGANNGLFGKMAASNLSYLLQVGVDGGAVKYSMFLSTNGSSAMYDSISDAMIGVGNDEWHMFTVVRSGTRLTYYIDDKQLGADVTLSSGAALFNGSAAFEYGRDGASAARELGGLLQLGRVYSRALHYGEILDLYNGGSGLPFSGATNVTVSPSAQVVTASIPTYTVSAQKQVTVSPSVQASTFSIPTYTVSLPKTVVATVQTATFSIPLYTVLAGNVTVAGSVVTATFSIPAYTIKYGLSISPSAQSATFSIPTYELQFPIVARPSAQVATFSIPAYAVYNNAVATPNAQVATFSIPTYTVSAALAVFPEAQVATFSIPAYSVVFSSTVDATVQVLTFSIPTLYKVGAVWTKTARSTDSTWSRTARNST